MSDELAFSSKSDLWLLTIVLTVVAACLWGSAAIWDTASAALLPVAGMLAIGVLLPIWILISLRHFLSDHTRRVRCGPFSWRIGISDIRSITPVRSTRSSPSMSTDRLLIEYGADNSVMISPEPRDEFLRQIEYRRKQAAA